jgi:hypothetical protein
MPREGRRSALGRLFRVLVGVQRALFRPSKGSPEPKTSYIDSSIRRSLSSGLRVFGFVWYSSGSSDLISSEDSMSPAASVALIVASCSSRNCFQIRIVLPRRQQFGSHRAAITPRRVAIHRRRDCEPRIPRRAARPSMFMMTACDARMPCLRALRRDHALPCGVRGPVDLASVAPIRLSLAPARRVYEREVTDGHPRQHNS